MFHWSEPRNEVIRISPPGLWQLFGERDLETGPFPSLNGIIEVNLKEGLWLKFILTLERITVSLIV